MPPLGSDLQAKVILPLQYLLGATRTVLVLVLLLLYVLISAVCAVFVSKFLPLHFALVQRQEGTCTTTSPHRFSLLYSSHCACCFANSRFIFYIDRASQKETRVRESNHSALINLGVTSTEEVKRSSNLGIHELGTSLYQIGFRGLNCYGWPFGKSLFAPQVIC